MSDLWDETDDGDISPICKNPNCSEFGEMMGR